MGSRFRGDDENSWRQVHRIDFLVFTTSEGDPSLELIRP